MAIVNSKQNWTIGAIVKVGFMKLMVVRIVPTPGDYAPDAYLMIKPDASGSFYKFVPHNGLTKLSDDEARDFAAAVI